MFGWLFIGFIVVVALIQFGAAILMLWGLLVDAVAAANKQLRRGN